MNEAVFHAAAAKVIYVFRRLPSTTPLSCPHQCNGRKTKTLFKVIKQERQVNWDKPGFVVVLVLVFFFPEAEHEEEVKHCQRHYGPRR